METVTFIGSDISLTDSDISITPWGDIDTVSEEQNIIQTAVNNMRTQLGEWFMDPSMGNPIFNRRIRNSRSGLVDVQFCCKSAILYDIRIKFVKKLNVTSLGNNDCMVEFSVVLTDDRVIDSSTVVNIRGGV